MQDSVLAVNCTLSRDSADHTPMHVVFFVLCYICLISLQDCNLTSITFIGINNTRNCSGTVSFVPAGWPVKVLTYIYLRMSSLGILALCKTMFLLSTVHYLEIVQVTLQCMECSLCFAIYVSSLFENVT